MRGSFQHAGFVLSEILISVMILAVLSVLLVGVIPASVIGLKEAGQRATAAEIARTFLEQARRDGYGVVAPKTSQPLSANGTEFTTQVEVGPATASTGLMDATRATEVKVTVRWKTTRGEPKFYVSKINVVKQI